MADATLPERPGAFDDPEVFRALVEGIPAIVYLDRPDDYSTNFYTSPHAVDLLGYAPEEWGTTPDLWLQKLHPEDAVAVKEENDRTNQTGEPFLMEYRMFTKDGRIVWIRDEAVPVPGPDGKPAYWRGIMLDVTAQKEAEGKLRWSLEVLRRTIQERRELALRLEGAQEEERRRIAADIHDDPIQVMSAVDIRLQTLMVDPSRATPNELEALHATVQDSIERLRSLVFELRPAALDREGLVAAIRQYLEHLADETGWVPSVEDRLNTEPSPDLRATLFRIVQEAVTNARKHAGASRVEVAVAAAGGGVLIRVRDDGRGFDVGDTTEPVPGHLGLPTVHERAELAGGWCRVSSEPGRGTTLECWLPDEDGLKP